MTRAELLAAAEALEWSFDLPWENEPLAIGNLTERIAELRAQSAEMQETIPIVDGSKPYYVDTDDVRRKYLPTGDVQDEPVAYASPGWSKGTGRCIRHLGQRSILEARGGVQFTPLYAHPDPRVAEYRELLRQAALACECVPKGVRNGDHISLPGRIRAALKGGE